METKELRLKRQHRARRVNRTRARVQGTTARPRLAVQISLKNVSAQIIDDSVGHTLAACTTLREKSLEKKTMTEKASWVGEHIAELAKKAKVSQVVFDRGAKLYHGRMAALADAARKQGLEF